MGKVERAQRGAVMLEATLALPIMLCLTLMSVDLLLMSYRSLSMQFVAEKILRQAVLPSATAQDVRDSAIAAASGLGINISAANIALCPVRNGTPCDFNTADVGTDEDDLLRLKIAVPIDGFIIGNYMYSIVGSRFNINADVVAQKEPA